MASNTTSDQAQNQLNALSIVERTGSAVSLIGCLFIIATFSYSKAFHKPINRLIFFASFGNAVVNIATLMATSYVGSPNSLGCQTQAFLIQMLMPADALWTLAMAINVYLTFHRQHNAVDLRKNEFLYLICCYGIPFIPAVAFTSVEDGDENPVYGNAVLWCWISKEWEVWRVLTFYVPIWIIVLVTLGIYIRTGIDIYRTGTELRGLSRTDLETQFDSSLWQKTIEIHITSEPILSAPAKGSQGSRHKPAYSVNITSKYARGKSPHEIVITPTAFDFFEGPQSNFSPRDGELSPAEWSYVRCSALFFTAMLITWIPSSANRVYSLVHGKDLVALEYMGAIVLPLQGFWNALIYIVTSRKACRSLFDDVRHLGVFEGRVEPATNPHMTPFRFPDIRSPAQESYKTDSTTYLAEVGESSTVGKSGGGFCTDVHQ
ncbi:G-protein coupled receptor [Dactylonectria estremocensis]|uniref:G-protein coupled receptor n=1 Tax=Dactylonectria estremocensis TaxID=1079267 RepID=A0A9P9F0Y3_9HYPO|nr:G-protein coupled receptor [Dactylonectria estremocensis]